MQLQPVRESILEYDHARLRQTLFVSTLWLAAYQRYATSGRKRSGLLRCIFRTVDSTKSLEFGKFGNSHGIFSKFSSRDPWWIHEELPSESLKVLWILRTIKNMMYLWVFELMMDQNYTFLSVNLPIVCSS